MDVGAGLEPYVGKVELKTAEGKVGTKLPLTSSPVGRGRRRIEHKLTVFGIEKPSSDTYDTRCLPKARAGFRSKSPPKDHVERQLPIQEQKVPKRFEPCEPWHQGYP